MEKTPKTPQAQPDATRRDFLKTSMLMGLGLGATGMLRLKAATPDAAGATEKKPAKLPPGASVDVRTSKKPNIIYIMCDDLGYGDLGCYGQQKIETPNIDKLAAGGKRFSHYYAGSAVSAPSRCITLTGLHSGHAYVRGNDELGDRGDVWSYPAMLADPYLEGQLPMPKGTITYPMLLQKAGYATACVGKWGLGYPGSEGEPNKMGFDFFYGYNCQRWAHTYYPPFLYDNEQREYLPNPLEPEAHAKLDKGADPYDEKSYAKFTKNIYSPDPSFYEILKFVGENKNNPFYLHWVPTIPHVGLQAPERWVKYYVNKFGTEKPYIGDQGYVPCRYPHATYAAMISYLDEQVGGLVQQLKNLGIYEDTIIVFTSDHGPTYNGGSDTPWFKSAGPLNNDPHWVKGTLREGGIRVPYIVSWPGKIQPNTQSNHLCAGWDVMATVCELTNTTPTANDGISFAPELLGKTQKAHDYLYWEFPEGPGSKCVRWGKWKGLILDIRKKGEATMMLFDLETDPQGLKDVAAQHPDIIATMRKQMAASHVEPVIKRFSMLPENQPTPKAKAKAKTKA